MFLKIKVLIVSVLILTISLNFVSFAIWGENGGKIFWFGIDGSLAKDGWKLIDDNNDGIGYYYYFDKDGFILIDDITPDYKIVGADGRRVGYDGNVVSEVIENLDFENAEDENLLTAELMQQVKNEQDDAVQVQKGHFSSGNIIMAKDPAVFDGPTPADGIIVDVNQDGTAKTILGKNK